MVGGYYTLRLLEARGGITSLTGFDIDAAMPSTVDDLRPSQRMNAALFLARLHVLLGEHARARARLASTSREELARMPARYGDLGMLCFLAEIYARLGDEAGAAALYPQLLPYATLNAVGTGFDYAGAVAEYLGMLANCLGQHAQAELHFQAARKINLHLGLRWPISQSKKLTDLVE